MIGLIKGTARQIKTVSGLPLPIASYKSNSKLPIKELSLAINPTQSGSGDPYPAGGGKNKIALADGIDFTLNNVRYYIQGGSLYFNGTSTGETGSNNSMFKDNFSFKLSAGSYYFTRGNITMASYVRRKSDDEYIATNVGAFTLSEDTEVYLGFYVYQQTFSNFKTTIQIESGSSATDYAPFSNIRPITGVSSVNVADMSDITDLSFFQGVLKGTHGVIVLDGNKTYGWSGGGNLLAYVGVSGGVVIDASTQYNIHTINSNPNFNNASWVRRKADKPSIGMYYGASSLFIKSDDITSADEAKAYFTAHPTTVIYELATPITPTIIPSEFVALLTEFGINGWCVNVQLGDTYYGATLDVVRGKLVVDRGLFLLSSITLSYTNNSGKPYVYASIPDYYGNGSYHVAVSDCLCSMLSAIKRTSIMDNGTGFQIETAHALYIADNDIDKTLSAQDFIDAVQTKYGSAQFCCPLTTPIEIDLTPTQINSLLGQNHIWHDGNGDVESLKFMDRQLYFGR